MVNSVITDNLQTRLKMPDLGVLLKLRKCLNREYPFVLNIISRDTAQDITCTINIAVVVVEVQFIFIFFLGTMNYNKQIRDFFLFIQLFRLHSLMFLCVCIITLIH